MASRFGNGVVKYFKDNIGIIIALLAMCIFLVIFPTTRTTFLTPNNMFNILRQNASNLFLATGMTMVIILGGIELSVGSVIALSGCVAAGCVVNLGLPEAVGFLAAILVGAIVGMFNGLVICKTDIPPFIVTLASMNIAKGIALVYTQGAPIRCMTDAFKFPGAGYVGPVPTPVILMLIVFVIAALMINRTQLGRHIYAVGGGEETAKLFGVQTDRVKLCAYMISGLLAALSGLFIAARIGIGEPRSGQSYEMTAITICVVGGVSMLGGKGNILGTFVGTMVVCMISNLMNLMNIDTNAQPIVTGIIILVTTLIVSREVGKSRKHLVKEI